MRSAVVTSEGDVIRWVELPGEAAGPPRVYVHGLGASSPAYFAQVAAHPLLTGRRSLLIDLLGHGISDRPTGFDYTLESHADALAAALTSAEVTGAELVAHSMGGAVAIVLATRHPHLVSRLVCVDANLDPAEPEPGAGGSTGIAAYTEQEFLAGGWEEVRDRAGSHWWSTMRLAGREALYRSAVGLARGTRPTMRELLRDLTIPRTFLLPAADAPLPGADALTAAGVSVVALPDCGHNIMLDNPDGFVRAVAVDGLPDFELAFPGPLRDQLVAAVLAGAKTSTTGLLAGYEAEREALPEPGQRAALVDSDGRRIAVVETTDVRVLPLGEIDLRHALDEGEGHGSVAEWRAGHEEFWHGAESREALGDPEFTVTDDTPVVAERFRVVHRLAPAR